jgi:hypothetical protein
VTIAGGSDFFACPVTAVRGVEGLAAVEGPERGRATLPADVFASLSGSERLFNCNLVERRSFLPPLAARLVSLVGVELVEERTFLLLIRAGSTPAWLFPGISCWLSGRLLFGPPFFSVSSTDCAIA